MDPMQVILDDVTGQALVVPLDDEYASRTWDN